MPAVPPPPPAPPRPYNHSSSSSSLFPRKSRSSCLLLLRAPVSTSKLSSPPAIKGELLLTTFALACRTSTICPEMVVFRVPAATLLAMMSKLPTLIPSAPLRVANDLLTPLNCSTPATTLVVHPPTHPASSVHAGTSRSVWSY
uniref:Uncharacterized protein n=1 Tax=Hemiselmis andersenii TaxID=464988 RepID=A0A7S0TJ69_HEMAN